MLADLRGGDAHEAQSDLAAAEPIPVDVVKAPEDQLEANGGTVVRRTDATIADMLSLLAEQREVAEALLRECSTLEERVKAEAMVAQAEREFTEATGKADAAALLGRRSKEVARAASARRDSLTTERLNLDHLIAAARAEGQAADAQVSEAEQRLREARQVAEQCSARLERDETRARECAANESVAVAEEREAGELVAVHEAAHREAEKEAQSAKERLEALKGNGASATQSFARIDEIEDLAIRIARSCAEYKSA
jgi:chromosome segregation ATPase